MKLERDNKGNWYFIRDGQKIPVTFSFVELLNQAYQLGRSDMASYINKTENGEI